MNGINNFPCTSEVPLQTASTGLQPIANTNQLSATGKSECHSLVLNNWYNTFPWSNYNNFWNRLKSQAGSISGYDRNAPDCDGPFDSRIEYLHLVNTSVTIPVDVAAGDRFEFTMFWEQISTATGKAFLSCAPTSNQFASNTYSVSGTNMTFGTRMGNVTNVDGVGNGFSIPMNEKRAIQLTTELKQGNSFPREITSPITSITVGSNGLEGRIYQLQVVVNGIVQADLIPVRVGTKGHLWNRVDDTLIGTGDYTLGPDIYERYDSRVEYVQTNGSNWLILPVDVQPGDQFEMSLVFAPTSYYRSKYLYGSQLDGTNSNQWNSTYYSLDGNNASGLQSNGPEGDCVLATTIGGVGGSNGLNAKLNTINTWVVSTTHIKDFISVDKDSARAITTAFNAIFFSGSGFTAKFYHISVIHNGKLIYDLMPVRKANVGCFYDSVTKKIYKSYVAAQPFTAGPDVQFKFDDRIRYIETTGTEWIVTDYPCIDDGVEFIADFAYLGVVGSPSWGALFSGYTDESSATWRIIQESTSTTNFRVCYNIKASGGVSGNITLATGKRYWIGLNRDYVVVNGTATTLSDVVNGWDTTTSMMTIGSSKTKMRIYRFMIREGKKFIHDYVPIRIGALGFLYDICTGEILGKTGTGNFVVGPNTPMYADYAPDGVILDFIPFTGVTGERSTVYIDFKKGDYIGTDFAFNIKSTTPCYADLGANRSLFWVNGSSQFSFNPQSYDSETNKLYIYSCCGNANAGCYTPADEKHRILITSTALRTKYTDSTRNKPMTKRSTVLTIGGNGAIYDFYHMYIEQNGHPIRDIIPVMESNDYYVCLYDRISGYILPQQTPYTLEDGATRTYYIWNYGSNLLKPFTQIPYIKRTGSTNATYALYLDVPVDDDDEIELIGALDVSTSTSQYIVGPIPFNDNNNRFAIGMHTTSSTTSYLCNSFGASGSNGGTPTIANDGKFHHWIFKNKCFTIADKGQIRDYAGVNWGGTTDNQCLFCSNNTYIARYRHVKRGVLVADMYPIYDQKGVGIYMYDRISGKVYGTSTGTGYTAGTSQPDINYDEFSLCMSNVAPLNRYHQVTRIINDYNTWNMFVITGSSAAIINSDYVSQMVAAANSGVTSGLPGMLSSGNAYQISTWCGSKKLSDIIIYSTVNCSSPAYNNITFLLLHMYIYMSLAPTDMTDAYGTLYNSIRIEQEFAVEITNTSYLHRKATHTPTFTTSISGSITGYNYSVIYPMYYAFGGNNNILAWIIKISKTSATANPTGADVNAILGQLAVYTGNNYVYCVAYDADNNYYILCANK